MSKVRLGRLMRHNLIAAVQPLCVEFNEEGLVEDCLGDPEYYGYSALQMGSHVEETLEFLIGLEPPTIISYPFLTTPNQRCARVSIHLGHKKHYVVIFEVGESFDRERRLQLAVNAHILSQSRVDKALRKLAEVSDRMEHIEQNFRWLDRRRSDALHLLHTEILPLTLTTNSSLSFAKYRSQLAELITLLDDGHFSTSGGQAPTVSLVSERQAGQVRISTEPRDPDVLMIHSQKAESLPVLRELVTRGYSVVECIFDTGPLDANAAIGRPKLVVIACSTIPQAKEGVSALGFLKSQWSVQPPLVLIALNNGFELRMLARRLGVRTFFSGPIRPTSLITQLVEIIESENIAKCRTLLLTRDSDYEHEFTSAALKQDIHVVVNADARQALAAIAEQQIEAVVVDVVASQIEAADFIEMLRQHESLFNLPLIALVEGHVFDAPAKYLNTAADHSYIKWKDPDILLQSLIARAQRYRRGQVRSCFDAVTGLLNRNAFLETFDLELERINRGRTVGCLALVDIDYFKVINDTFGHAAGDAVLRNISKVLLCRLRKTDLVARYAGDELVVMLSDTGPQEAATLMNAVRTALMESVVNHEGCDIHFTISCGLQELRGVANQQLTADMSIRAADKLLYNAKKAGRNRVCVSG